MLGTGGGSFGETAEGQLILDELRTNDTMRNATATGSATRVARLLLLDAPPSLDRGEITDKGTLNQRAVLTHRADRVDALYREGDPAVIRAG